MNTGMVTLTSKESYSIYNALQDGYNSLLKQEAERLAGECGENAKAIAERKAARLLGSLRTLSAKLLDSDPT